MTGALNLVTGGLGFLGGQLVRHLRESGQRVRVLDDAAPDPTRLAQLRMTDADVVVGSVLDPEAVRVGLEGVEVVHHVAGIARLWDRDPAVFERVNVGGTERLLEESHAAGVRAFVHTSSELLHRAWCHGRGPIGIEDLPGAYLRSKLRAEELVLDHADRGLRATILCPAAPLGPGDVNGTPPTRMLRDFLSRRHGAYVEGTLFVVDVRDVAAAFEAAVQLQESEADSGPRRFVLCGHAVRFSELLLRLERLTGRRLARRRVPYPVAALAGRVGEALADHVTHREPPATRAGVRALRLAPRWEGLGTFEDLGVTPRPLQRTLIDTLESMGESVLGPSVV